DDAALARTMAKVDPMDARRSDYAPVDLNSPGDAVRSLPIALKPVLFLGVRERPDAGQEPEEVDVFEPALVGREVFLSRWPERAFLAAKHRAEHPPTLRENEERSPGCIQAIARYPGPGR